VFERFAQADSSATRQQGGLGLGLAIVKRLVELHGGTVSATSKCAGCGATFELRLPYPEGTLSSPPLIEGSLDKPRSSSKPLDALVVLVVDDNDDARELMAVALSQYGAKVILAGTTLEARERLGRDRIDVLVSDVGMPGDDGYSLIEWVRKTTHLARLPAIALTGYAGHDAQKRSGEAGFDTHLTKPADIERLVTEVDRLLRARRQKPPTKL
jgi:CheY-like chemotaxis protein